MTIALKVNSLDLNDRTNYVVLSCDFTRTAPVRADIVEYAHRPGGKVGQVTTGVRQITVTGLVIDTAQSSDDARYTATEDRYHDMITEFSKPYPRITMAMQGDERFWVGQLTEVGDIQWLSPRVLQYSVVFTVEHPYAYDTLPVADVAAGPTFSTVTDLVPPAGDAYYTAIMALNPAAYWRMDEIGSAISMIDSSGNGCHGVYTNTPTLGVTGSMSASTSTAVTFTAASSEYAQTQQGFSPLDTNNVFTYAFAVKRASVGTTQYVFSEGPATWVVAIYFNSSNKLVLEAASGNTIYTSTLTMNSTSSWYHCVITKTGSTTAMYVNGASTANAAGSDFTISTAGSGRGAATIVNIGSNRSPTQFFNGTIDEFAIFPVALSSAQASELYAIWSGSTDSMRGTTRTITTDGDVSVPVRALWSVNTGSSTVARWQLANLSPAKYAEPIQRARVQYSSPPRSIVVMDPRVGGSVYDATSVVGYFPLMDASGNARDFSGNDYTLTANGTPTYQRDGVWLDGVPHGWGGSLLCNGSGDYFSSTQAAFNASATWTAGLWVKLNSLASGVGLIGKAETNKGWSIYVASDGTVNASVGSGAASSTASSVTLLQTGYWYHIAMTYYESGGTRRIRLYIDGMREAESAPGNNISSSTNDFVLGRTVHTNGTTYHCNGYLTEAFVVGAELTQQQILDIRRLTLPYLGTRLPIIGYVPEINAGYGATNAIQLAGWQTTAAPAVNMALSWRPEWR